MYKPCKRWTAHSELLSKLLLLKMKKKNKTKKQSGTVATVGGCYFWIKKENVVKL